MRGHTVKIREDISVEASINALNNGLIKACGIKFFFSLQKVMMENP